MRCLASVLLLLHAFVITNSLQTPRPLSASSPVDFVECITCRVTVEQLIAQLESNSTLNEVVLELDKICDLLPSKQMTACRVFASQIVIDGEVILPLLLKREQYDPATLCTMLSYCQEPCCTQSKPEQVHIALAGDSISSMSVLWVTLNKDDSFVRFGTDPNLLNGSSSGIQYTYTFGGWSGYLHRVYLHNLSSDTKYYYSVGGSQYGYSEIFNFRTHPSKRTGSVRFGVVGDMGIDPEAEPTINALQDLVQKDLIDVVIHTGDISYADGYQHRWDEYFRRVQPVVANIPYMVCPGNHEIFYVNAIGIYGYDQRFIMPGNESGSSSNTFYSWNYGYTHFISLNSETTANIAMISPEQVAWLKRDLEVAKRNRDRYPWIVVYLHRPLYCSNDDYLNCGLMADTLRSQVETIFYTYRVDLVIQAHKHGYERTKAVFQGVVKEDGKAPIYIVNGAGGNREGTTPFPPKSQLPHWAEEQIPRWGYGIIDVNPSNLTWMFYTSDDKKVKDSVILTR